MATSTQPNFALPAQPPVNPLTRSLIYHTICVWSVIIAFWELPKLYYMIYALVSDEHYCIQPYLGSDTCFTKEEYAAATASAKNPKPLAYYTVGLASESPI